MLAGLNLLARLARPWLGSGDGHLDPKTVTRILVVELWNIGDIVLTMPFLAQLRALFPAASVTLVARPHAKLLLEGSGLVDEFIETELAWTDAALDYNPFAYDWRELRRLHRQFRDRQFDVAFQCRMHIREHFILALSGARRRVGYAFGQGDRLLTDAIAITDPGLHKSTDWLRLLGPFADPVVLETPMLRLSEWERAWASDYLSRRGVMPSDITIGVHPGASIVAKRWPLERFHAVAETLARRQGLRIVAFSDPDGLGESLGEIPAVIGAKVGLRELIALVDRCDLLVCNDSGPMHIAGALGVPTVAVFAPGIDRWFSPLGDGHQAVTADAHRGGQAVGGPSGGPLELTRVPTTQVLTAVERALQQILGVTR